MSARPLAWLRPDAVAEPLINSWYAWSYLIAPATAARFLTHAQLPVLRSFVEAPETHVAALRDPALRGGPFIDYPAERAPEIQALLERSVREQGALIALSQAIAALERLLQAHPRGHALGPLYARIPEPLRGYVELVYDAADNACVRYQEGLLYASEYYRESDQGVALHRMDDTDRRAFVMSTPRLDYDVFLSVPFASPDLDALFAARTAPVAVAALAERLGVTAAAYPRFAALFTSQPPRAAPRYAGPNVRVRYFGHACILVETARTSVLVDPLVSCEHPGGMARFSLADLPARIDTVLITHNHQDHVMLETLLQLRGRIGRIVVPAGQRGSLLDPSLKLALKQIGFADIQEIDRLEALAIPDGRIVSLPVLGEHGDLDIATKTAWWIEALGGAMLCAADSDNLDGQLYDHVRQLLGAPDLLFLGMECQGAPYTWAYGPLLGRAVPHRQAQARRLNGSDAARAADLIARLDPREVCVYAMGQEPWLNHITSIHYTDESFAIVESDKLVAQCLASGRPARRLLGQAEFELPARPARPQSLARLAAAHAVDLTLPPTTAPSLLVGEGWGEGEDGAASPSPLPSPVKGEGESFGSRERSDTNQHSQDGSHDALGELLDELHGLGVYLSADADGTLKVDAPKGVLSAALTARLKQHKPELVSLLKGTAPAARQATANPTTSSAVQRSTIAPADNPTDELPADARLPDDVRPAYAAGASAVMRSVLLTGATGFVGAFLLHELLEQTDAKVHCLVRIDSDRRHSASDRIRANLERYGLWKTSYAARTSAVAGDLAAPALGLAPAEWSRLTETVDTVFHNGAQVHHLLPYARLRAANVGGTLEALRLACAGRPKVFHHISTLSVLPPAVAAQGARFLETEPLARQPLPAGGYNHSKWMAELLVEAARARGLPAIVYRPGPVCGDSASGRSNPNDFLYRLLLGYVQSGVAPEGTMPLDLLPVDYLARALVFIARRPEALGKTVHLLHPHPASSEALFAACRAAGHDIRRVPYAEWFRELQRIAREAPEHALYPLVALFSPRTGQADPPRARAALPYDTEQAQALLREAPFAPPALDAALFGRYLQTLPGPVPLHA